jgi:hypothetical protein
MNIAIHYEYVSMGQGHNQGVHLENTRLFSTVDTVIAIGSPIKLRILDLVAAGSVSFDLVVERTEKAKSTISVHIRDLLVQGSSSRIPIIRRVYALFPPHLSGSYPETRLPGIPFHDITLGCNLAIFANYGKVFLLRRLFFNISCKNDKI